MSAPPPSAGDGGLYQGVQRTLVGGMILSFTLMGLGLVAQILNPQPHPEQVIPLDQLPTALIAGNPLALLDLGVLALMAIPAVHLTVAAISFGRSGDRRFFWRTLLVLGLLAAGAGLAFLRR